MRCPQCQNEIPIMSPGCPACGINYPASVYEKLLLYFEMKRELESLNSFFYTQMGSISTRLYQLDQLIEQDMWQSYSGAAISSQPVSAQPGILGPSQETQASPLAAGSNLPDSQLACPGQEAFAGESGAEAQGSSGLSAQNNEAMAPPAFIPPPPKKGSLELHVGQKWALVIGIILTVFGVGFFLKFSFDQGWVGPAGRVALAYLLGIGFLVGGELFRRKKFEVFGLNIIGGGIAVLYFATYATFQIYNLFGQTPSFIIMVLITLLAGTLAIVYDTKWLAVLGLIGGFLTPVLLSTRVDNQIVLMSYMALLNLGILGIAFYKKWNLLNLLGFIATYLLFMSWSLNHYQVGKFWPTLFFITLFFLIYSVIPFVYEMLRVDPNKLKGYYIITPNTFIAFGYSYFIVQQYASVEWVGLLCLLYSFIFLFLATYLYRVQKHNQHAFVVFIAQSLVFLIVAVPIVFSQHWVTIFWTAQATALLWVGVRLGRKSIIIIAIILLFCTLSKLIVSDYPAIFKLQGHCFCIQPYIYLGIERMVTILVALLSLTLSAWAIRKPSAVDSRPAFFSQSEAVIRFGWLLFLFLILNFETAAFFYQYAREARLASVSVLWTLFSIGVMLLGIQARKRYLRTISIVLFVATILKVMILDMSKVSTPYRILSFIILGLILIGTSYLYYKFKDRIEKPIEPPAVSP